MNPLGCAVGVVVGLVLLLVGGFVVFAGALTMNAAEAPIPPELEAAYRQVGARAGVHWSALAAWDGASDYVLPIPSVDEIFSEMVADRLEEKRRDAEDWCRSHPDDTVRCPPDPPSLTEQEQTSLWRRAHAAWRQALLQHIERHASLISPVQAKFEQDPETVYRRFLGSRAAARAAELFEGYQLLDSLASDSDEILIPPTDPPPGWVPVDGFAWPVVAPVTSRFGMRESPIDGEWRLHAGMTWGWTQECP